MIYGLPLVKLKCGKTLKKPVRKNIRLVLHLVKITVLSFVILFFTGLCLAEDLSDIEKEDLKQFMTQLENAAEKIESFRAVFVQEKELSLFAETMVFHGELVVVRPDRLRWEFTEPVPSVLILNGEKGLRCNAQAAPTEFDLKTDPIMRSVAEQLWLWLGGDYSRLSDSFSLKKKGANSLFISPKDEDVSEFIESVTIVFDLNTMQPQQVVIREPGGDFTRLRFSDYSFNIDHTDPMFTRCQTQPANDN